MPQAATHTLEHDHPVQRAYSCERIHDNSPRAHLPTEHKTALHVRIVARELLHRGRVCRGKDQETAWPRGPAQRTAEHQRARRSCMREVSRAQWRACCSQLFLARRRVFVEEHRPSQGLSW